ncbi:hypothetical protein [Aurantibacillus circumpalustris]|uniref:hypothetical protein n=1 Tax=Aurantibacillus circumpalustris TaxID=3036359 RepID=UPI00295BB859|nr:hypothetical protein [Aurantibacillus circumpalustris]
MNSFKEKITAHCKFILERKIELVSFEMDEISASMENETKSSAGDKHETARARMQSEYEKLSWQLDELKGQLVLLERIDPKEDSKIISNGNLVQTNKGLFFIAVPLGKVELDEKVIYVISPVSPLGKKLMGLKISDEIKVNTTIYRIEKIS